MSKQIKNKKETPFNLGAIFRKNHISLEHTSPLAAFKGKLGSWMKEQYASLKKGPKVAKAAISIVNSALTQERAYFTFSRETARTLVKEDVNWGDDYRGISHRSYRYVIAKLIESNIIELYGKSSSTNANVYRLTTAFMEHFNLEYDREQHKAAADRFLTADLSEDTEEYKKRGTGTKSSEKAPETSPENEEIAAIEATMPSRQEVKERFEYVRARANKFLQPRDESVLKQWIDGQVSKKQTLWARRVIEVVNEKWDHYEEQKLFALEDKFNIMEERNGNRIYAVCNHKNADEPYRVTKEEWEIACILLRRDKNLYIIDPDINFNTVYPY